MTKNIITLFHGTSSDRVDSTDNPLKTCIKTHGFAEGTYFTNKEDIAEYFAETAVEEADERTGKKHELVVLKVMLDLSKITLLPDSNMYCEPLTMVYENQGFDSEDDWHSAINDGELELPETYQDSLDVLCSVVCKQAIPLDAIVALEID